MIPHIISQYNYNSQFLVLVLVTLRLYVSIAWTPMRHDVSPITPVRYPEHVTRMHIWRLPHLTLHPSIGVGAYTTHIHTIHSTVSKTNNSLNLK